MVTPLNKTIADPCVAPSPDDGGWKVASSERCNPRSVVRLAFKMSRNLLQPKGENILVDRRVERALHRLHQFKHEATRSQNAR